MTKKIINTQKTSITSVVSTVFYSTAEMTFLSIIMFMFASLALFPNNQVDIAVLSLGFVPAAIAGFLLMSIRSTKDLIVNNYKKSFPFYNFILVFSSSFIFSVACYFILMP